MLRPFKVAAHEKPQGLEVTSDRYDQYEQQQNTHFHIELGAVNGSERSVN